MMYGDDEDFDFEAALKDFEEYQQAEREAKEREKLLVPEPEVRAFILSAQEKAPGRNVMRCLKGEPMVYHPWARALLPGHIYSREGLAESGISRVCEFHFDEMFAEVEEDSGPAVHDVVGDL